MNYGIPTSVEINGKEYAIRWDFRCVLEIIEAMTDMELDEESRALIVLDIFYPDLDSMPICDYGEAIEKCLWFIRCGDDETASKKAPKLMDWEQDFKHIVSPINRVLGREVRSPEPLHWWTFISAYYEIGDCYFAQIVRIRSLRAKGKKLDKQDMEFYRENKSTIDIKTKYTQAENELLKKWGGGVNG